MATLADDVIYLPPDSPRVSGQDAVGTYMQTAFFDLFTGDFDARFVNLQVLGSTAVAEGAFDFALTPKAGDDQMNLVGKFYECFPKGSQWLLALHLCDLESRRATGMRIRFGRELLGSTLRSLERWAIRLIRLQRRTANLAPNQSSRRHRFQGPTT